MAAPLRTRWVGIDEAGYGPNLGPLVMTAVTVEGSPECVPDVWADLRAVADRAGGRPDRIWIDDSKRVTQARDGLYRLCATTLALLRTVSTHGAASPRLADLLISLEAGTSEDGEWSRWMPEAAEAIAPWTGPLVDPSVTLEPSLAGWHFVSVRSVVVGPAAFNAGLDRHGNKASVHFETFGRLLTRAWSEAEGCALTVHADKHGGRHYYHGPLQDLFADHWIERGVEGPELSRYAIRTDRQRMALLLAPRSDAGNGLVALASIVSKALRERWMAGFNAFWQARIEGLRPTAGYPVDARRFRGRIEGLAAELGLAPRLWWRER